MPLQSECSHLHGPSESDFANSHCELQNLVPSAAGQLQFG